MRNRYCALGAEAKDFYATLSEVKFYSEAEEKPRHYSYLLDRLERLIRKLDGRKYIDQDLMKEAKELVSKW